MPITKDLIEVPEDALLDALRTHVPIWNHDFSYDRPEKCEAGDWDHDVQDAYNLTFEEHVVAAIKVEATAARNERLERQPRDSRQEPYDPHGGAKHRFYQGN